MVPSVLLSIVRPSEISGIRECGLYSTERLFSLVFIKEPDFIKELIKSKLFFEKLKVST